MNMEARKVSPYRKLSYQLFGAINGPSVELSGPTRRNAATTLSSDNKEQEGKNGSIGRCLICYSSVDELEVKKSAGFLQKKSFNMYEFLGSLVSLSPVENLGEYLDECANIEKRTTCHHSSSSGACSCLCLCQICSRACEKYLSKQRAILKLKQEANELKEKFIAAVQQSTSFALKESKIPSVKQEMASRNLKSVNAVRACLLENRFKNVPSLFDKDAADCGVQVKVEPVVNLEGGRNSVNVEQGAEIACATRQEAVSNCPSSTVDICPGPSTVISSTGNKVSMGIAAKRRKRGRGRPKNRKNRIKPPRQDRRRELIGWQNARFWKEQEGASYYMGMEIKKNENGAYLCPLGCTDSDIIDATKFVIIRHVNKFHSHGFARHHCNRCPESFYYESDLVDHKKLKHSREDVKCDVCGSFFSTPRGLQVHKGSHYKRMVKMRRRHRRLGISVTL